MNLKQQVAHLKACITDLIGAYRQSNTSLEYWFTALWNAEQALNIILLAGQRLIDDARAAQSEVSRG